ncbi:MAG: alpha/beta hydrolase [Bacteroidetes bacterium]|nr:alpha/beta hydrolase [Bacteroidota bacterium]
MKLSLYPILAVIFMVTGCSSTRFYYDAPPLAFEDIDYTFPTASGVVNGVQMAWHDSGGNGPVVVLVHGLASNAGFWRYNVAPLTAAGLRVIAVDLPGYGKSAKAYGTPYGIGFYAQTLDALLAKLNIPKAVIAGHSMGGQVAMTMALQGSTRMEGLILLSPAGIERFKDGEGRWMKDAVSPAFVINTPEDRVRANLSSNFYDWRDELEWMVEERVRMAKDPAFERFAYVVSRCVAAMIEEPVWQKLDQLKLPVLILAGEKDNLIPNPYLHGGTTRGVMEAGAAQMPSAKLRMIPEAGHMIQIEKPEIVNTLMIDFMNGKER